MTAKELREKREKLRAEIKRLHAEGKAVDADGAFTAEWTKLNAEYDALTNEIEKIERVEAAGTRLAQLDADAGPRHDDRRLLGRGNADHRPQSVDLNRASALAVQAWFRCNSSRDWDLTDEHREACALVGLKPTSRELCIKLIPDDQVALVQQAFASSLRAHANVRAHDVIRQYRAALSSVSAADGATIMVPESMLGNIEVNMLAFGGILQAAEIMRTSGRERVRWPTVNDTSNKGRRLGENQAVTSTAQPTFGAVYWDLYKYTSDEILVPNELLAGTPYNLAGIIGGLMGERIGRKFADDGTTGTGGNQPKGIITAATAFNAASATAISWDDLDNLIQAVDPAYRLGAAFMFHDAIRNSIRKLKDGNGRPLWADGPNSTEPVTLKGYPWFINQSMDSTIASGKKTVLFGRLSNYKVRQFDQIRIYRLVERHRENDQDAFLAFSEMDGNLLDAGTAPVKYLSH